MRKYRRGLRRHGKHPQLLYHTRSMRFGSIKIFEKLLENALIKSIRFSQTNLQWFCNISKRRSYTQVIIILLRDLKPANILLRKGIIKIGDFGFAKKNVTKRMKNASSVGTPLYMPLQILKS
jgi:serine/threonine protein kinase